MGGLTGMLGLGGGAAGTGFAAPQGASQTSLGISENNVIDNYNHTQNALSSQKQLLEALQAQNGLQNQSNVYNQFQDVAQGNGPNPAQAQYKQNINQLASQQAGAIASQKGLSPALQARMIAQQTSGAMQNAAGQGASNLAAQQLAALGQAGAIATNQVGNQIGQQNSVVGSNQASYNSLTGASNAANANNVSMQGNINSGNAGLANTQLQGMQGIIGSAGQGAKLFAADGADTFGFNNSPQSKFGQYLSSPQQVQAPAMAPGMQPMAAGVSSVSKGLGGQKDNAKAAPEAPPAQMAQSTVPYTSQNFASDLMNAPTGMGMATGGPTHDYRAGGNVMAANPAQKAVAPGNSYANDKIPAVLSEGEVVIPRNIMQSKNPSKEAAKFVEAVLAKRKVKA